MRGNRNKRIEKYFEVSVVVDMGCRGTKEFVNGKFEMKFQLFTDSEKLKKLFL